MTSLTLFNSGNSPNCRTQSVTLLKLKPCFLDNVSNKATALWFFRALKLFFSFDL